MRRIVALEWDSQEAGVVVASGRGSRLLVEQAFRVDLRSTPAEKVAETVAAALAARRVGRGDALVAISRSLVELRQMSLPAAPDEELPDLVRFQALREFNSLDEDWPLDFRTLDQQPDQPRYVLAATVRPSVIDEVNKVCEAAGLKPLRLAVRCCTAASLLKELPAATGAQLLVDIAGEDVDLTVYEQQKVVFIRQARLTGNPLTEASTAVLLLGELRRTLAAAQNRPCGVPIGSVVLWNAGEGTAALAQKLSEQLSLPVTVLDPFQGVTHGTGLGDALSEPPGRLAPLVGLLRDELAGEPAAFDFLHPRRRPEPPSRRRTYLLAGAVVVVLGFAYLLHHWLANCELEEAVVHLQREAENLKPKVARAEQTRKAAGEIAAWTASDRNWLEEFQWLSSHLPPAENAVLTHLDFTSKPGSWEIVLEGLARDVDAVTRLQGGLGDATHRLTPKSTTSGNAKPPYALRFTSSVSIAGKEQ